MSCPSTSGSKAESCSNSDTQHSMEQELQDPPRLGHWRPSHVWSLMRSTSAKMPLLQANMRPVSTGCTTINTTTSCFKNSSLESVDWSRRPSPRTSSHSNSKRVSWLWHELGVKINKVGRWSGQSHYSLNKSTLTQVEICKCAKWL